MQQSWQLFFQHSMTAHFVLLLGKNTKRSSRRSRAPSNGRAALRITAPMASAVKFLNDNAFATPSYFLVDDILRKIESGFQALDVTVNDPLPPGTRQLVNTAAVTSDQTPDPVDDDATTDVAHGPEPTVSKTPSPAAVPEPGGTVTFTVSFDNTAAGAITLTGLSDDVFGDLLDPANPAVANNTCPLQPASIPGGGSFSCSFDAYVAGDAGDPDHVDTVTAFLVDGDGRPGTGSATATVPFTDVPPAVTVATSRR